MLKSSAPSSFAKTGIMGVIKWAERNVTKVARQRRYMTILDLASIDLCT
jgi:hypothetical protein